MQENTNKNEYDEKAAEGSVFTFDDEEEEEKTLTGGNIVFNREEESTGTSSEKTDAFVDVDEFLNQLSKKTGSDPQSNSGLDLNAHFEEQSAMLQSSLKTRETEENVGSFDDDDRPYYEDDLEEEIEEIPQPEEHREHYSEEQPLMASPQQIPDKNSFWEDEEQEVNETENGIGSKNEKLKKLQASASNEDSLWNRSKDAMNKVFVADSIDKKRSILGIEFKFWKIFLLLFYTVDVVFYNFAVYKIAYPLIENISKSLGIEALKQASYEKYYVMFSYVVAFFVGGAMLMLIMKLARRLLDGVGTQESVLLIRIITGIVLAVFLVGGVIMGVSKGFLTSETYRWFAPCLAYLAGLLADFWF